MHTIFKLLDIIPFYILRNYIISLHKLHSYNNTLLVLLSFFFSLLFGEVNEHLKKTKPWQQ